MARKAKTPATPATKPATKPGAKAAAARRAPSTAKPAGAADPATSEPAATAQAVTPPPPPLPPPPSGKSTAFHTAWPLAAIGTLSMLAGNPLPSQPPPAATVPQVSALAPSAGAPTPLLAVNKPVDWWFAYKFSSQSFPGKSDDPGRACPFDANSKPQTYGFSQKYAVASNLNTTLTDGPGLIGTSGADPLGATFGEIYSGKYYFVVWNDQFKGDPSFKGKAGCTQTECGGPWGHSKGVLAWDNDGNGVLVQVTTPSWPGAGGALHPRAAGNTLGCVSNDDDVSNAQDFFSVKLNRDDVKAVLGALATASVSTDVTNPQLVNQVANGQPLPADLAGLVGALGKLSATKLYIDQKLSGGVRMIVKPSALHVPPWQFVSSVLGGEPLLSATWWANPPIASTRSAADVHCWDPSLKTPPGEVDVALSSTWDNTKLAFTGGPNHAKVGVSLPISPHHYAIFGDLNQQGQLGNAASPNDPKTCASSQNGRGGMFFVVEDQTLANGVSKLLTGTKAPFPN